MGFNFRNSLDRGNFELQNLREFVSVSRVDGDDDLWLLHYDRHHFYRVDCREIFSNALDRSSRDVDVYRGLKIVTRAVEVFAQGDAHDLVVAHGSQPRCNGSFGNAHAPGDGVIGRTRILLEDFEDGPGDFIELIHVRGLRCVRKIG